MKLEPFVSIFTCYLDMHWFSKNIHHDERYINQKYTFRPLDSLSKQPYQYKHAHSAYQWQYTYIELNARQCLRYQWHNWFLDNPHIQVWLYHDWVLPIDAYQQSHAWHIVWRWVGVCFQCRRLQKSPVVHKTWFGHMLVPSASGRSHCRCRMAVCCSYSWIACLCKKVVVSNKDLIKTNNQ